MSDAITEKTNTEKGQSELTAVVRPAAICLSEWVTFNSEYLDEALIKLAGWVKENPVDPDLQRTIEVDYSDDEGLFFVSICGRFAANKTIADIRA